MTALQYINRVLFMMIAAFLFLAVGLLVRPNQTRLVSTMAPLTTSDSLVLTDPTSHRGALARANLFKLLTAPHPVHVAKPIPVVAPPPPPKVPLSQRLSHLRLT